jgi:hypothetical protein
VTAGPRPGLYRLWLGPGRYTDAMPWADLLEVAAQDATPRGLCLECGKWVPIRRSDGKLRAHQHSGGECRGSDTDPPRRAP